PGSGTPGLVILDVSDIQKRVANPTVKLISQTTWPDVSIPQVPIPVTIGGHPYLVEVDEYATVPQRTDPGIMACSFLASGLRVFDIRDPQHPRELAYYNAPPSMGTTSQ